MCTALGLFAKQQARNFFQSHPVNKGLRVSHTVIAYSMPIATMLEGILYHLRDSFNLRQFIL